MLENNHSMTEEKPGSSDETPDPQVKSKTNRRAFTVAYKLSILEQADLCQGHGEVGALLRREGLYSSHLSTWRRLRREGTLQALKNNKRGPTPTLDLTDRRGALRHATRGPGPLLWLYAARTIAAAMWRRLFGSDRRPGPDDLATVAEIRRVLKQPKRSATATSTAAPSQAGRRR